LNYVNPSAYISRDQLLCLQSRIGLVIPWFGTLSYYHVEKRSIALSSIQNCISHPMVWYGKLLSKRALKIHLYYPGACY